MSHLQVNSQSQIAPISPEKHRPTLSVMIPTYNCANFLSRTLESVLSQDNGPDKMQIEVVDDCSTKDDPEEVVKKIGRGRIDFYRKPRNEGATATFNTCIQRSRGHLVHILHGDDYVLPGFYETITDKANIFKECSGFFSRCIVVSASGELDSLSPRLKSLENSGNNSDEMLYCNQLRTPGVVVRRSFYETHGGFQSHLIHVADWEMWIRVIQEGSGLFINQPLAAYRFFDGNDTSKLAKSAENLKDYLRLSEILKTSSHGFDIIRFYKIVESTARFQADQFKTLGDHSAERNNRLLAAKLASSLPFRDRLRRIARTIFQTIC
jgi:glycosyltransferase involved in cell wall biosynthesis